MVLIVDDDPLLRALMHRALAHHGIEPLVAVAPAEAVRLAGRYPVALLVTDLMMPGMTGIELVDRVRRLQARVPVLLVSGTPDAGTLVIEQPSAFLAKPFSLRDLAASAASLMAISTRPS
jgi:DNA-binding response OmpR family regulator